MREDAARDCVYNVLCSLKLDHIANSSDPNTASASRSLPLPRCPTARGLSGVGSATKKQNKKTGWDGWTKRPKGFKVSERRNEMVARVHEPVVVKAVGQETSCSHIYTDCRSSE